MGWGRRKLMGRKGKSKVLQVVVVQQEEEEAAEPEEGKDQEK